MVTHTLNTGVPVYNYYVTDQASLDALTVTSGMRIGIQRGLVLRGTRFLLSGKSNVLIEAFGAGADPLFFGSVRHTSGWADQGGNIWQKDIGYTAVNCYGLAGETVTKYTLGTYASLTSGQFGVSGNSIRVFSAIDPNALTIEIPTNGTIDVASGIYQNAGDNNRVNNLRFWFWGVNGFEVAGGDNFAAYDCDFSYNSNDGGGTHNSAVGLVIDGCSFHRNGQVRGNTAGAAGDGFSLHDTTAATVRGCTFTDNEKEAIGNQPSTTMVAEFNYLRGNYQEIVVLGSGGVGSTKGSQTIRYNVIVWVPEGQASSLAGIGCVSSSQRPDIIVYDNSIYCDGTSGSGHCGIRASGGDWIVKNNIIKGFNRGIDYRSTDAANASMINDYNCMHGNTTNYFNNGTPGVSAGANDITADPLFVNAAVYDFRIQSGSPCRGEGVNVGLTVDYAGNPVTNPPDIGAYQYAA